MLPLTSNQRAIWFDQKLFPNASLYNVPAYTRIKGSIDPAAFGKAIGILIAQSDVLRAQFHEIDGVPQQVFKPFDPSGEPPLNIIDFSRHADSEEACMSWMKTQSAQPLRYAAHELYSFALLKKSGHEYFWYLNLHHTISDAWSNAVMIKRLAHIYDGLLQGTTVTTETLFPYAAYVAENLRYQNTSSFADDAAYWQNRFATIPKPVTVGIKEDKKDLSLARSMRKRLFLEDAFYQQIQAFAAAQEVTVFHVFLGVLYTYFSRINQTDDLVIGVPVLNRPDDSFKNTVGLFVAVLPVRLQYKAPVSFETLVRFIRDTFREDMQHQRFPLDEIVRMVKAKAPELPSLYDITLSFEKQNYNTPINGFETETASIAREGEKEPLSIFVRGGHPGETVKVDFDFNLGHWDEYYMDRFMEQFPLLFQTLIRTPEQTIDRAPLITEAAKALLLRANPAATTDPDTLVAAFEQAVQLYPGNIAVAFETHQLSYTALNAQSNALAHYLRNHYLVRPGAIIAYSLPKSHTAIIVILGILKSGAAYLPIDPAYPEERKEFMLEDSGASLVITSSDLDIPAFKGERLFMDHEAYLQEQNGDPVPVNEPDDTSYVIYTSGSTGKPKGALIRHRAAVNIVMEYLRDMQLKPSENCLQFASLSFDASVLEIFMALFSGATLFPVSKDTIADFNSFATFIDEKDIAALILPPSYLRNLDKASLAKARMLMTAGEPAISRLELGLRDDQDYYNAYGPTECTVCTTIFKEQQNISRNVPLGKPIGGMQVFILDQNKELLPYGVPGELFISGIGLAKGYLNNPALTAEKFIPSPFEPGKLMYRSGDVGRRLSDGRIEYLGRSDDQVKIRGHRIELGEIEVILALHAAVQNVAVVIAEPAAGEKSLYAFVVPRGEVTVETLFAFLRKGLPHFMIPDRIFLLDRIPLTMNGKVDKRALLAAAALQPGKTYAAPETEQEKIVAGIWQQLLGMEKVSVTDNFFQIGGHSLKVGQFINRLHQQTGIQLLFSDVFHAAVLKDVAALMNGKQTATLAELVKVEKRDAYPLSSSQKRLYLLHQIDGADNSYNIPRAFWIKGPIDHQRLEHCFQTLIDRHEILRTAFEMHDGVPVQIVKETLPFHIAIVEGSVKDKDQLIGSFIRTFDLATPPLLRVQLCHLEQEQQLLLFDMHHIISDGVSAVLFMEELMRLYHGQSLEPLALQYKDFAAWQNDFLASGALKEQEAYWLRQFADEVPVLNLQTDLPRPAQKTFKGKRKRVQLPQALCLELETTANQMGYTLNQLLLATFKVLLYKYSGNEDIVVGSPVAGRTRAELDKVLGVFINTLALRSYPTGQKTFRAFLAEVKQASVDALKNQEYPFELLIEQLDLKRDMGRNPLFDIMFSFVHEDNTELALGDALLEPVKSIYDTSKFDLLLEGVKSAKGIELKLEYSTDLFTEGTVTALLEHYVQLLEDTRLNLDRSLGEIRILSAEEEKRLLAEDVAVQYPDTCLHLLFERQVTLVPDHIALVWQGTEISYSVLNERANAIAAAVQAAVPGVR
ncbi:non-ribosomal peptide synthetase, partial [Taibaiella koreensis]|uniref:non-ribosomal peptide synthetase n=1 Tax=Taibaiella koreensis TaxID=1268548 RepID=UPI0013C2A2D5